MKPIFHPIKFLSLPRPALSVALWLNLDNAQRIERAAAQQVQKIG